MTLVWKKKKNNQNIVGPNFAQLDVFEINPKLKT